MIKGFSVSPNQVYKWRPSENGPPRTANDCFVRDNPLCDPENYPGLQNLAQSIRLKTNTTGPQSILRGGLELSGDGLLGLPGAVLKLICHEGQTQALLALNGTTQSLPIDPAKDSEAHRYNLQIPGGHHLEICDLYSQIALAIHAEDGAGNSLAVSFRGAQPEVHSIAAFNRSGTVAMTFENGAPQAVVVNDPQGNVAYPGVYGKPLPDGPMPTPQQMVAAAEGAMRGFNNFVGQ